jgi:GAF domain-containing protein
MADQIAVALDNARLLRRSQQAVAELQATRQERVLSAWQYRQQTPAFEYDRINVTETEPADEQAGSSIQDGIAIVAEQEGERSVLSAPLRLRDQTIGGLSLEQIGAARSWTEDEIELVEEVSEQIALALENARLFEEAQERAIRERAMSEVTNKMRETLNVDSVIRTAVEEIYAMLDLEHVTIRLTEQAGHPADSEEEGTI